MNDEAIDLERLHATDAVAGSPEFAAAVKAKMQRGVPFRIGVVNELLGAAGGDDDVNLQRVEQHDLPIVAGVFPIHERN